MATISLASQAANSVVVYVGYVTLAFSWFLKWRGIIESYIPLLPRAAQIGDDHYWLRHRFIG